jgi:hypothetical protein
MKKAAAIIPAVSMGDRIPRILHQHFLLGDEAIPQPVRSVRDALRAANSSWEYSFWDAPRAEAFIRETYGESVLSRYLSLRPEYYAARSDLLRYLALYVQGGVYLDIKSTCDRPLDQALRPDDKYLLLNFPKMMDGARSPHVDDFLKYGVPEISHLPNGEYVQWVIVTVPGHPFLRAVIERVLANIDSYSPLRYGVASGGTLRVTGPIAYSLEIESIRDLHPHSGPMSAADRGFRYSGLEDSLMQHRQVFGRNCYHDLEIPMVDGSRATAAIARLLRRATRNEAVARKARRVRAMLNRRPT